MPPPAPQLNSGPSEHQLDKQEMTAALVELSGGDRKDQELHQRNTAEDFPQPARENHKESSAKSLQECFNVEKLFKIDVSKVLILETSSIVASHHQHLLSLHFTCTERHSAPVSLARKQKQQSNKIFFTLNV